MRWKLGFQPVAPSTAARFRAAESEINPEILLILSSYS